MSYVSQISQNDIEDSAARKRINSLIDEIENLNFAVDALCDVIRGLDNINAIKQKFYKRILQQDISGTGGDDSGYVGDTKRQAILDLTHVNISKLDTHEDSNIF